MKGTIQTASILSLLIYHVCITSCQAPIKVLPLSRQEHAKPRQQPSDRDQRARDRLRNKASAFQAK